MHNPDQIRELAIAQRRLLLAVLLAMGTGFLIGFGAAADNLELTITALGVALVSAAATILLALRLLRAMQHDHLIQVLVVILLCIPWVGLLSLLIINMMATRRLREYGLNIGLFGASRYELDQLEKESSDGRPG
jgi:hypothetical protein